MHFKSVKLVNFGCISSFEKELSSPLLILSGDNGNGKSTVLKAILLSVFDSYSGTLGDYVKWGCKSFTVTVVFSHKAVDYTSIVHYDGSSTDRTLSFEGKVFKGDEAKRKVKEVIDVDLLKASMLSLEQQIDIVTTKPAERRDYLKKIYDLEFKQQLSDLSDEISQHTTEVALIKQKIDDLNAKEYNAPEEPLKPFSAEEFTNKQKELENTEEELRKLKNQIEANKELFIEIGELDVKISLSEERLKTQALKKEETDKQYLSVDEEYSLRLDSIKATEKTETSSISSLLEKASKEIAAVEMLIEDKNSEKRRTPAVDEIGLQETRTNVSSLEAKIKELENAKDVCVTCGQSITSEEQIAARKETLEKLKKDFEVVKSVLQDLEEQKTKADSIKKSNEAIDLEVASLEQSLIKTTASIEVLEVQLANVKNTCETSIRHTEEEKTKIKKHLEEVKILLEEELSRLSSEVTEFENKKNELLKKVTEVDESNLATFETVLKVLETEVDSFKSFLSKKEIFDEILKKNEEDRLEDEKQISIQTDKLKEESGLLSDLQETQKILKTEFPVFVISKVIKTIETNMNEFLKKTYSGKYEVSVIDKKNSLHIVYGPKQQDVSLSSGYEKSLFNLAFKIAISKIIGNRCLLLDEADAAASTKNSGVFYKVLGNSVGEFFNQIILVSHKETIRDMLETDFGAEVVNFVNGEALRND